MVRCLALILFTLSFTSASEAVEQITVLGLFKDRALVSLDGKQRVLRIGKPSPEGVRLISADSKQVVLEMDGARAAYGLGQQIGALYSRPAQTRATIWRNALGMYTTTGSINGRTVDFLVDTGASKIAMNAHEAKRLGIDFRYRGTRGLVNTAAGAAPAFNITLNHVAVGTIVLRHVEAFVLEGDSPRQVLLGMSFLGRVKMENSGQGLVLRHDQ